MCGVPCVAREQAVVAAEQRVQGILAALQASPNGLVLLDAQGHIQWCNRMAERHFGFDAQRDIQQTIGNLVRDPAFSSYWSSQDFTHPVLMLGRDGTPSRPVMLSVRIYPYGDGRRFALGARRHGTGAGRRPCAVTLWPMCRMKFAPR